MPFEQRLQILIDIDRISDESEDVGGFALQLVGYLADIIKSDLVAFSLPNYEDPITWNLQAVVDRAEILSTLAPHTFSEIAERSTGKGGGKTVQEKINGSKGQKDIHIISIPQILGKEILGILFLARKGDKFRTDELELLEVAGIRLDSALRHFRVLEQLKNESLAMQTVLQVDRVRDTSTTLDELLDRSLSEVTNVIAADVGFIMLYDHKGNRLEMRAITDRKFLTSENAFQKLYGFADSCIQNGDLLHVTPDEEELRTILGVPLILNESVVGVLGVINPINRSYFNQSEQQLLKAIASQMDTAIFERIETQRIRDVFGRNVGSKVMKRLLQIPERELLHGERVELTILFSDIRGFTAASATTEPQIMEGIINDHFEAMVEEILIHEGTLDKFLGDGVMAFFNAPERQPKHARLAVNTALAMQSAQNKLISDWEKLGLPELPIGIGIASGEVLVGNFGSHAHAEYSAIGSTVNLAARLCEDAEGGQVLVNERTKDLAKRYYKFNKLSRFNFKGFNHPVPVWELLGSKK